MSMRVAIIGGGIAGLAAAYELEQARAAGAPVEYELFEASSRLGGVLSSELVEGTVIEHGPDSFLTEKPAAAELCRELGLGTELMGSNDAARKTFIVVRNRLIPLPDGLMFLVPTKLMATAVSPLFSWWTKLRMGLEVVRAPLGPHPDDGDESVAALVRRHYGQQVVERLADPLLSGIYGGDAEQLSARAVLPKLVEMEARHGSLTRGVLAGMRERAVSGTRVSGDAPRAIFTTLRGGLQQMVDALVLRLEPQRLHTNCAVSKVEWDGDAWLVDAERYDTVIVAVPAWAAAKLLRTADAELSGQLAEIPYSSSITVNLVYDGADLDPLPPGFGFLVPAAEGRAMLACTFIHRKFPGRTAPGRRCCGCFWVARGMRIAGGERCRDRGDGEARADGDSEHFGDAGAGGDTALAAGDGAVCGGAPGAHGADSRAAGRAAGAAPGGECV